MGSSPSFITKTKYTPSSSNSLVAIIDDSPKVTQRLTKLPYRQLSVNYKKKLV